MREIPCLTPVYKAQLHENFREMLNYAATAYRGDDAFILKKKNGGEVTYKHIKFEEFLDDVNALGTGLMKRGLLDKRVAIIGKNRYEWVLAYFAVLCGGGICVPLDKGLPMEEAESSLERSYADIVVFDKDHTDMINEIRKNGQTSLTEFICMDEITGFTALETISGEGREALTKGETSYMEIPLDGKKWSIILFTSGTTSMAKAVLLSQYNITANIYAMLQVEDIRHGDVTMAFLPYHHTFGSTGQCVMLAAGVTTTYCDGLKYLQKNIVEYKVSMFVCVPLLIESIYKKIMQTVKKQGKEKTLARGMKISKALMKVGIDARRKIFKSVLDQLGGNLRYVISGASAIDPEALEGFRAFGIEAVQGYGMTESAPVLAAETPTERKTGSIGRAMPGVQLRIIDENEEGIGELVAKGPNVMEGYYENEEETAKVLADGWLHTGDLVSLDEDGYIFIRGRRKNVIVLKNGKNVYPEEMEVLLTNLPYVTECMVFGQPRHKDGDHKDLAICAKIVYDREYMERGCGLTDPEAIHEHIKKDIDAINEELPVYKQMLRVITTDEPMIKTTTGKVKRHEEAKNI